MNPFRVLQYKEAMANFQACSITDEGSRRNRKARRSRGEKNQGHLSCGKKVNVLSYNDDSLFRTIQEDKDEQVECDEDFDSSIEILFDYFSAYSVHTGSHHQVRMNDDEIRRLWRSQEIEDLFDCSDSSNFVCSSIPYCMEVDAKPSLSSFVCTEIAPQAATFCLHNDCSSSKKKIVDAGLLLRHTKSKFDDERTSTTSIILCREI